MSTGSASSVMREIDLKCLGALGGPGSEELMSHRRAEIQAHVEKLFDEMKLPPAGRHYVLQTMVGSPTQVMRHNTKAVKVKFPSRKMGASLTLMGRTGEAAHALRLELRPTVLAYYMQTPHVLFEVKAEDGRVLTKTMANADALVVEQDIRLREFRDEAFLIERSLKNPYQVYQDASGTWHYRAAEEAYAPIGLQYEITTNQSLPAILLDNARFLEAYCREDCPLLNTETARQLVLAVHSHRYASLRDLIADGFASDEVYQAILAGLVYVDLERTRLDRPAGVYVYPSEQIAQVHQALQRRTNEDAPPIAGVATISPGTKIRFKDGTTFRVEVPGEIDVQVRGTDGVLVTMPLKKLLDGNDKAVELISPPNGSASDALSHRTTKEVENAVNRLNAIDRKLAAGESLSRTERRHFAKAKLHTGRIDQVIASLDNNRDKGNRTPRLPAKSEQNAKHIIETYYNTEEARTVKDAFKKYCEMCSEEELNAGHKVSSMSYKAFRKRVRLYVDVRKREGAKAAYQVLPPTISLQNAFPVHGSYAHECLYIDSTVVNMQTLAPSGIKLGKFTMTLGIDGGSRQGRCLAFSFDKAGRWTFFLAIRDYVKRHGRLPRKICVDNGPEFNNGDFIFFCDFMGIEITWRKPGEPRGGAMIESLIGVTEEMVIKSLKGNTVAMKNPRSVSPEVNGFNRGEYDLAQLYIKMERFIFEQRNKTTLPSIGATPDELEEALKRERGERTVLAVAFNSDFLLMTSPHPKGWTRKYDQIKGIFIFGRYYRAPEMKQVRHGTALEVRVEGWLARVVYVMISGKWRIAVCNHPDLANHTRREDELAVRGVFKQGAARRYQEDSRSARRELPAGTAKYDELEHLRQEANLQVARHQFDQVYAMSETAALMERLGAPLIEEVLAVSAVESAQEVRPPNERALPSMASIALSKSVKVTVSEFPSDSDDFLDGVPGYH